eukprot:4783600-Prymnesium_polylepis.1
MADAVQNRSYLDLQLPQAHASFLKSERPGNCALDIVRTTADASMDLRAVPRSRARLSSSCSA